MTTDTLTPEEARLDAQRGYYAARKFQRHKLLREGLTEPINDEERAVIEERKQ